MDNYSPNGRDCVKSSGIFSLTEKLFSFLLFFNIKSMSAIFLHFGSSSQKVFPQNTGQSFNNVLNSSLVHKLRFQLLLAEIKAEPQKTVH